MKVLFGLLVSVGLVLLVVYRFGGYAGFDATEQGDAVRAKIGPGMAWKQVFDITGDPRKYQNIKRTVKKFGRQELEVFEPGPPNKFRRTSIADRLAENSMPHGFITTHNFSNSEAFTITFDGSGTVVSVVDAPTLADLLQTRD